MLATTLSLLQQWQTNKAKARERTERIREAKTQAKIRRIQTSDDNAAELDRLSIAQRGWKDEYLLLVTTTPLILCFVPGMVPHVDAGFAALNTVPEYYWYGLAMVYIDSFGFRRMLRQAIENWHKNRLGGLHGRTD
ncbi:hypothetical protein [Photobacterium atrarenae]|uniref:Holin of 3TMs, for gene-transfer release n=1 Tax=Photobacterium atrarenae TaxID=865757 RepID=A0ABY5GL51_9GAMM|nr:hypothetical protein [Photobacterium atrarenae]UTV30038.1 hypothetical protein NNL38_23910 [Photobacterium atrarenae]